MLDYTDDIDYYQEFDKEIPVPAAYLLSSMWECLMENYHDPGQRASELEIIF